MTVKLELDKSDAERVAALLRCESDQLVWSESSRQQGKSGDRRKMEIYERVEEQIRRKIIESRLREYMGRRNISKELVDMAVQIVEKYDTKMVCKEMKRTVIDLERWEDRELERKKCRDSLLQNNESE